MSRYLVGMSGDKDAMIAHLEKCEKRMLEQFAEIRELAATMLDKKPYPTQKGYRPMKFIDDDCRRILELCDVYLDKRSDKQKMQDQIDEMQQRIEKMAGDSECECC